MCVSDQDLLSDYAKLKDPEAFAELVTRYQSLVFSTSVRQLANRADAEEVTQDVFLALAVNAEKISSSKLGGWLYRTTLNAVYSRIRSDRARSARERERPIPENAPDKAAEWHQIEQILDTCMTELPDDTRELIIQRFFLGRSQQQLAEDRGVNQSTVSRRLSDAINQLRQHMKQHGLVLSATGLAAAIAEHTSATSLPPELIADLNKIGVAGFGGKTVSAATASAPAFPWLAAKLIGAVLTLLLVGAGTVYLASPPGPTTSVAVPTRLPPVTPLYELSRLDYSKQMSASDVAINSRGAVVMYTDLPEEWAGLYVVDGTTLQHLGRFPSHRRRSMAIGDGSQIVFCHDSHIVLLSGDIRRTLTDAAVIDIPASINRHGQVTFLESEPTSRIRVAGTNDVRTAHEAGDRFAQFHEACINDEGDLAFRATNTASVEGIYLSRQGEITAVAEIGERYQQLRPWLTLNNRGQIAFIAQRTDGMDVICIGDDHDLDEVVRCGGFFAEIYQISLNDIGQIAFTARKPEEPTDPPVHGLYLWDGDQVVQVLAPGQQIGDKPLHGTVLWYKCLNDVGQIAILSDFGPSQLSAVVRLDSAALAGSY